MRKDEKINDFCECFDAIVREYETCQDVVPLSQQEKSFFYEAVSSVIPELRNADLIQRQTNNKEMTLEENKSFTLQLEAEKKADAKEVPKIQRAQTSRNQGGEFRCYRCNETEHYSNDCPLADVRNWFCYYCQAVKTHKGDECPNAEDKSRGKRYNKQFNKNDRGRNNRGRRNDRGKNHGSNAKIKNKKKEQKGSNRS